MEINSHFTDKQVLPMDLALLSTSRSLPPENGQFYWNPVRPIILRRTVGPKTTVTRRAVIVMAQNKKNIEGVSGQLNSIASQNLDQAMARRRVRSAFTNVQQQLDHILFKLAPAGIRTEEWYEINSNGQEIFCKSWLPKPGVRIKGALCFCHGYGDTCTFFFEGIAKHIASSGYGVYAIDHPGFGLSEGLHGYVPSFDGIVDNVNEQYTIMKGRPEIRGLPRFIFGQSMGGAIAIKALLKTPKEWDGIVLVAPMCKISKEMSPPLPLQKILILMSKIMPKAKLVPKNDLGELAFRELKKKQMAPYNVISYSDQTRLRTAVELLNATKDIESHVYKIAAPMLILHGASDKVTDPLVSKFLYENASSKDKTLKIYEDGCHCILEGEPDDRILTVLGDIVAWLDSRTFVNKTCLTLAISRIKLLQNKRDVQLKAMKKEIAQFLVAGQEAIARIRVEHVIREQNTWESYEIIELFCEFVLARVPILESQRECPTELREAVASIIFAAPKCSDLPDLLHVRNLFAAKYGKEFIAAATELRPDTSVNRTIIEKLTVSAPPPQVKLGVLKEIALEYNVDWDSTKTEAEFSKKPEDLLNGPKKISVQLPNPDSRESSSGTKHSDNYLNGKNGEDHLQSPVSRSITERDQSLKNEIKGTSSRSSDVLQQAFSAIAAAERASASARAAAELVNAKFSSLRPVERKI